MVQTAVVDGSWVMLQNVHLMPKWLHVLDNLIEEMNPEKVNKARRDYYARNKEAELARIKKWREENKEYFYAKVEAWRLQNMERVAAKHREWTKNNPTKVKEGTKKWRSKNPDKVKAMSKRAQVKRVENLTNKYINDLFKKQVGVASIKVPPGLIEAMRVNLFIKRKLKELSA
jgi:hypothetical protein